MATRTRATRAKSAGPRERRPAGAPDVESFMRDLDHPLKAALQALREILLSADSAISEGIKWNSPSFRTSEYFATINVHGKDRLRLILHLGAKVKDNTKHLEIADPEGLPTWLAKDRALVTLGDMKDVRAKRSALAAIVQEWIKRV